MGCFPGWVFVPWVCFLGATYELGALYPFVFDAGFFDIQHYLSKYIYIHIYIYIVKNICFSGWGKAGKGFCFTDRFWGNVSAPLGC